MNKHGKPERAGYAERAWARMLVVTAPLTVELIEARTKMIQDAAATYGISAIRSERTASVPARPPRSQPALGTGRSAKRRAR